MSATYSMAGLQLVKDWGKEEKEEKDKREEETEKREWKR